MARLQNRNQDVLHKQIEKTISVSTDSASSKAKQERGAGAEHELSEG